MFRSKKTDSGEGNTLLSTSELSSGASLAHASVVTRPRAQSARSQPERKRRTLVQGLLRCIGLSGLKDYPPPHPMGINLAERKRSAIRVKYDRLTRDAENQLPASVLQQIRIDVCRTFGGLPSSIASRWAWPSWMTSEEKEAILQRVLLAWELYELQKARGGGSIVSSTWGPTSFHSRLCRSGIGSQAEFVPTYVQGCSMMAAMCLGFVGGREEEGFWLFLHLLEDVLGPEFLSRYPPLIGFHGDRVAAANLVACSAPKLCELLGPKKMAEATSTLSARCFLSLFCGFIADEPLVALWEELLPMEHSSAYPRSPLLAWLAGIVQVAQDDLARTVQGAQSDEIVPMVFSRLQQVAKHLPVGWRPAVHVDEVAQQKLRKLSEDSAFAYSHSFKEQQELENHAKQVKQSLERVGSRLLTAVRSVDALTASEIWPLPKPED